MYLCFILVGVIAFANVHPVQSHETEAPIESYPYRVAIEWHFKPANIVVQSCGGRIISSHWVVTVASCNINLVSYQRVRSGSSKNLQGGTLHQVDKFVKHEGYRFETSPRWLKINDIGLVRVLEPFVQVPISLPEFGQWVPAGVLATQTGWFGRNDMVISEVPMVGTEYCDEIYKDVGGIAKDNVCSSSRDNDGDPACGTMIGDALVVEDRLVGIVSWSRSCLNGSFPVVDTNVAYHRRWIDRNSRD